MFKKLLVALFFSAISVAKADFLVYTDFYYYNYEKCLNYNKDYIFKIRKAKKGEIIKENFTILENLEKEKVKESNETFKTVNEKNKNFVSCY